MVIALVCCLLLANEASGQRVALTFDDLPAHGPLPDGTSRLDVAREIIQALKSAHAPPVYGFINAKKLQQNPEDMAVLKLWTDAGFLLGNHTYSHLSLNANTGRGLRSRHCSERATAQGVDGRPGLEMVSVPFSLGG
jgi:peptidoglycan/xylan/chitin deacetylase (PgdA/CDA1 family)